ncbi:hypothetical protein MIMGU_mgv1a021508mg [Erythranthe guttata]|uniref:CST complex subunit STN1 n=1 Tax=Erythranthe guttata TaxID=4155 RepID=A0A022Q1I9_ERYGU|nr:hypothetical protein MIMGU_mgv1a021508mg [Erythranthe guttata]
MEVALYNIDVKILSLQFPLCFPSPKDPSSFSCKGTFLSRAEIVGFLVTHDVKHRRSLRFTIDDRTRCIPPVSCSTSSPLLTSPCATHQVFDRLPQWRKTCFSDSVGCQGAGRITVFRGIIQNIVSDVVSGTDPDAQVLHWLDL